MWIPSLNWKFFLQTTSFFTATDKSVFMDFPHYHEWIQIQSLIRLNYHHIDLVPFIGRNIQSKREFCQEIYLFHFHWRKFISPLHPHIFSDKLVRIKFFKTEDYLEAVLHQCHQYRPHIMLTIGILTLNMPLCNHCHTDSLSKLLDHIFWRVNLYTRN